MRTHLKKFFVALILLAMITATLFMQVPKTYATEPNNQEKALTFLGDVIQLDMSFYTVEVSSQFTDFPPHWNGMAQEVIRYTLDWKNESVLYATIRFRDHKLYGYSILTLKGSPIYVKPQSTDTIESVKCILDKYLTYSQTAYIKDLQNALKEVNTTNDTTIVDGIKLAVSSTVEPESNTIIEEFEWMYTVNGVDVPQNFFNIFLENGTISAITDNWNLYKIGSDSVKVSKEEAINIATKAANEYTLMVMFDDWTEIPFNLSDMPGTTELFMYPRDNLTVFPLWSIELYFDKQYSSVYGLHYGIWADTGETAYCSELSYAGGPINETTQPLPQQSNDSNWHILAILSAIIAVIVISAAMLRKK
ncbi:MAG: hypothetical protein LBC03_02000 [Nitrososphaerota archaeon]|jgi:hypothetical protein|nr:hypothetical protein [Nitrososphaerota archaeon]